MLVTGAGSGIGRCIAERLAAQGHRVIAAARRDEDIAALGAIAGIQALRLDVRDAAQVDAVAAGLTQLDGLVNNAGIGAKGSPGCGCVSSAPRRRSMRNRARCWQAWMRPPNPSTRAAPKRPATAAFDTRRCG